MSKFKTAGDIRMESRNFLDTKEYISKEDLYKILTQLKAFDCYHTIGKAKVWSLGNDMVVDETQELLIKVLKKELERD